MTKLDIICLHACDIFDTIGMYLLLGMGLVFFGISALLIISVFL